MRDPNSPRFASHTAADELREALGWHEARPWWSDRDVVDAVAASEEVAGWLNDRRPYSKKYHQGPWTEAIEDFTSAVTRLGPAVQAMLQPQLRKAQTALTGFPGTAPAPDREPAKAAMTALRQRWSEPLVLEAAWHDLLAACRDDESRFDIIAARRDLFWRLAGFTDWHPRELSGELCSVLDGSTFDVTLAQVKLGDIEEPPGDQWGQREELSELTDEEILELCRRLLFLEPTPSHHVIWLTFTNAASPLTSKEIGPVTLFDGPWLRARLNDGSPRLLQGLPAELSHPDSDVSAQDVLEGKDVVLARVDLGKGVFADPAQTARERLHALVGLARFRTGSTEWTPVDGYRHAIDGVMVGFQVFRLPGSRRRRPYDDPVGRMLAELTPKLWDKLAQADKELRETVGAVQWWQEAQQQQSLAALVLNVRVIELTATRVCTLPWTSYLDTYLASAWIRATIINQLFDVVSEAVADPEGKAAGSQAELRSIRKEIETPDAPGVVGFGGLAAVQALPRLIGLYPVHSLCGRRLRQLAERLASPATLADWAKEIGNRWKTARARLRRSRNAIAHGGPVIGDVTITLDHLSRYLSAWSLSLFLDSSSTAGELDDPHETFRKESDAWLQGLRTAPGVLQALFPE
ncbi:hypothetical protein ACIBHX_46960 [Nonomuraea sp. NPDC050536]|uniref:hypothetical protein n=1 Tax=Nonomuraea sp. NPDC050536 TaxID=3364366 RepID=UPI0037C69A14